MKRLIYFLPIVGLLISSCNTGGSEGSSNDSEKTSSEFNKDIDLPENPCNIITKEMVTSNFDVADDKLEIEDNNMEGHSEYESCSYKWKKGNYKELHEKRLDVMMNANSATQKEGAEKTSMSDLLKMESPFNKLGVGSFKMYDDLAEAEKQFTNLHIVPTHGDMEKLDEEIDKESDKRELSEEAKETGKNIAKGIGANLKFTEVDGVGDQASYDHLDKSLDVRFGTLSFSLIISTENGLEKDIELGKKLAKEIYSQL